MAVTAAGVLAAGLWASAGVRAQAPPAPAPGPTFDVASVKRNTSGTTQANIQLQPNGATLINLPLRGIIQIAYGINQPSKLVGAPGWTVADRFDIIARASGTPSQDEMRVMLQALLVERFSLIVRLESRELPVYALVMARPDGALGPQLQPSSSACTPPNAGAARGVQATPPPGSGAGSTLCGPRPGGPGRLLLVGVPIPQLVNLLSLVLGRTVMDKTELTGRYDIDLSFAPDRQGPAFVDVPPGAPPIEGRPSVFTAVQEQLGLKLDARQDKEEVLVIDRVEQPTED